MFALKKSSAEYIEAVSIDTKHCYELPSTCESTPILEATMCKSPSTDYNEHLFYYRAYISCKGKWPELKYCSNGYLYNRDIRICDTADLEIDQLTTKRPLSSFSANDPCLNQNEGVSFPLETNCRQYILCLGNDESVVAKCPVNSWYDPDSGLCGPNVSPTACIVLKTTTEADRSTPGPAELCADEVSGISYPLETDCAMYILCLGDGEFAIVRCIFNAWYDPSTGVCGPDISPTACEVNSKTTTTESTSRPTTTQVTTQSTTSPTTTTDLPISKDICGDLINGEYVAYPDNCSKYIVCVEPIPIAFYCTPGYYFSETLQTCVDWQQSDCGSMATTIPPPGQTTPTEAPNICTNNSNNTLPYTENCQWFIRCMNDNVYMMGVCNVGEYYDPLSGQCGADVPPMACRGDFSTTTDSEYTITDAVSTTTDAAFTTTDAVYTTNNAGDSTTSETTTELSTTTTPEWGPCQDVREDKLVPYPNDCTKFIRCSRPTPVVYSCVEGQEFSAQFERCLSPLAANCSFVTA